MIDAHHHIWRQDDLPWLKGPEQPRIFGPYGPIRRDYPVSEFLDDLDGTGITKSVYVQVNWAPDRGLDEARWVQSVAEETGWPHAIVAFADMTVPDARPALDALADVPLVRGIRHQFHWHEEPLYRFAPHPDLCEDANVQANVARLADYGFTFDLQIFAGQVVGAARLAQNCPDVTFILQHAGMWEDTSPDGKAAWEASLATLASRPNVATKLSGFGTFLHRNDPAHVAANIDAALRQFGPDRCMFGSNFPIEKLWTSYAELLDAHLAATAELPEPERAAIFHDTAARLYRI